VRLDEAMTDESAVNRSRKPAVRVTIFHKNGAGSQEHEFIAYALLNEKSPTDVKQLARRDSLEELDRLLHTLRYPVPTYTLDHNAWYPG
jgi:hypothetical protein